MCSRPPVTSVTGVHKVTNVLGCLPKAVQAGARKALAQIRDAPDRDHAQRAIETFARDYGVKWPKAVAKITDDAQELLCFFDYPAEHWQHLKTSNPIWVNRPEEVLSGRAA
jgi:putative transposase